MAFPEWKNAPFFEVDRVGYLNSAMFHANAAFNLANS